MLTHRIHLPDGTEIEFFASDHFDEMPFSAEFSACSSKWLSLSDYHKKRKQARKAQKKARQKQRR